MIDYAAEADLEEEDGQKEGAPTSEDTEVLENYQNSARSYDYEVWKSRILLLFFYLTIVV